MTKVFSFIILLSLAFSAWGQVSLNADGPGETYELINSVFAPGYNVVEAPDCSHSEFGRHIDEVYDDILDKYVFRFHIHVTPDNDRCKNFDRQRNEIKSYDKSPSSLKAVLGETVLYEWKFKIDAAFQSSSSFTHIHQIKAVGGTEESMPLITFTCRKGSPDQLELRYAKNTSQTTLKKMDLTPFKGAWVSVKEVITFGEEGSYKMRIERVSDGQELFEYSNENIRMWKTGANFLRPKWGIYRSLNNSDDLRDELLYFSDFSITEGDVSLSNTKASPSIGFRIYPNPAREAISIKSDAIETLTSIRIYDQSAREVLTSIEGNSTINIESLDKGLYYFRARFPFKTDMMAKFIKL